MRFPIRARRHDDKWCVSPHPIDHVRYLCLVVPVMQDLSRQRMRVAAELGYDLVAVLSGGFADVCGARCPDLAQIARS